MRVMNIDLHIHSSFSDGAFTPSELVAIAIQQDVRVIAIADHDSVAGIGEATVAGAAAGITVLPAVELSVQFEEWQDVHLLGYGINFGDEQFLFNLDGFRKRREGRNGEILERVNDCLHSEGRSSLDLEHVLSFAHGSIGRPHIARALLERGYADTVEDAFRRYLVPCNVPKIYWPMADAIAEIHRIGGVAVLAHPTSVAKNPATLGSVIAELQLLGLDGIEVYNNMGWPLEIEFLRRTALELDLLMTAGSDFHGIEEGLEIGRGREGMRFDSDLLAPLYERIESMRLHHTQPQKLPAIPLCPSRVTAGAPLSRFLSNLVLLPGQRFDRIKSGGITRRDKSEKHTDGR
ncbi:MAG: PHP domain-containing protein [Desulfuromonadaceae bacterium]